MAIPPYSKHKSPEVHWLGSIPEHWQLGRLKFSATSQTSNVDKHTKDNEIPIKLCNYVEVYNNEFIVPDMEFMAVSATPVEIERFTLKKGDVLITKDSESWDDIAVPALVASELSEVLCGYHLAIIRSLPGVFHPGYLFRLLSSEMLNYQFKVSANGVTRFGLPSSAIDNAILLRPPIGEQRVISDFIGRETTRIDALVKKRRQLLGLLEEKLLAVVTQAVTKGLDPKVSMKDSGIDWLGEIPAHWNVSVPLKYLIRSLGGSTPSTGNAAYWNGNMPWVSPKDMKVDEITDSEDHVTELALHETGLNLIAENSVLIVVRGMILDHTFPVAVNRTTVTLNQDMKALIPDERLNPDFLAWFLRGISKHVLSLVETSAHGTKALRTDQMNQVIVPIIPHHEQASIIQHILARISEIGSFSTKIERQISLLQEYRSALITNAVTGKIDVRGWIKDEAAA